MSKLRLLIADDSADFRRNVRAMLSGERDIEIVAVARDGYEALEMARKLQPDVAVMDLHMPGMNGLETVQAIATISPQARCLIMSVDHAYGRIEEVLAAGALEYLLKPFTTEEFVSAIRRAMRGAMAARPLPPARPLVSGRPLNHAQVLQLLKTGRMDDEAARAYVEYIQHAEAQHETLARLAEVFCARREWRHLRLICERMERAEGGGG